MTWLPLITIFAIGSEAVPSNAESAKADPRQLQIAELQLQGWKNARDSLTSGVFRARGRMQKKEPGDPECDGPIIYYCAFDYHKNLFRLDHDIPNIFRLRQKSGEVVRTKQQEIGKYCRTPPRSFEWTNDQPGVIYASGPLEAPKRQTHAFDVRCLGLLFYGNFERFTTFEHVCEVFVHKREVIEVAKAGKEIWRISFAIANGSIKADVWFNQEMGYSPVRLEVRGKDHSALPFEVSEVTWTQVSGVWVPKTFATERTIKDDHRKIDLVFDWESVNQPVPDVVFQTKSLLPAGERADVVSRELGSKPIILERVRSDPLPEHTSEFHSSVRKWLAGLSLFVVLVAIVVVFRRRLTHR